MGWKGGVLAPDGCIYCAPAGAERVLQIDTKLRRARTLPVSFYGEPLYPGWKWSSGILHPGTSTIFCIPSNAHSVLAIGPIGIDPAKAENEMDELQRFRCTGGLPALRSMTLQSQHSTRTPAIQLTFWLHPC